MDTILDIILKVSSIIGIIVLIWYTIETSKIRKNADRQLILQVRPFLEFKNEGKTPPYFIRNVSDNVALNIFLL